ncbi:NDR1/HIN1-like protein 10 [Gastrolobium bilobum]|uniref:NDR1/HIN1-like protein 10 n=1 Tax=Gastrolobium bilobum TaxID=150636 RepID=UPI002AB184CC|nr:NDR1/HIN1-like protein 10 [Gastrolobium bilobum]
MTIIFFSDISPSQVKFYVTEASLMQFNLTNNTTLYYNFKVNITVRNPNKHIIVYYRVIRAIAWYKDNDFAYVSLTPFDQGHKNTSFLQPVVFEGHTLINLTTCQLGEYIEETRAGIYNLAVNLDLTMRMKFGWYKRSRFNPPIVQCSLIVPLISNGKSATPFNFSSSKMFYFCMNSHPDW